MLLMQLTNKYLSHSGACFQTFLFWVETHDETPCSDLLGGRKLGSEAHCDSSNMYALFHIR